jgi:hypothetical protein
MAANFPPSVPIALTEVNRGGVAALRQNAQVTRGMKLHCERRTAREILSRLLNELT